MPLIIADVLQVTIEGHTADGPYANVFHVEEGGGSDINTQATALLAAYLNTILPVLCDSVSVTGARFIDLSAADGHTGFIPVAVGDVSEGGVHVDALPPQCSILVGWGGVSERGVRNGRSYLPGVRSDEVSTRGDISPTQRGTYQTACEAFISQVLADAGQPLVVAHNPASGPTSFTEILGCLVETPIATQRRRLKR